eukprot:XP_791598.3 PREDICTED: uncharacterized protein LOC586735 isoform X1 [Strongylocentrotus purpuratus]
MTGPTTQAGDGTEHEVVAGEYPWQVALYNGEMKLCSAVLIHEQWLLTAASCIPYLKEPYTVIAGAISLLHSDDDTGNDDGSQHTQRRMTSEIYIHPGYDARRMESDIALVKVMIPFELNDNVNVICLPNPKMHRDFRPGSKTGIAGWGHLPPVTERPGMCPKPTGDILNECDVEMCETDAECSEGEKCCRNGCDVMTCMEASPPGPGPRPGALMGGVIPLINHTMCNQTMMGAIPKGVICAGPTPMKHEGGGKEMMEEGGIVALLKWKREMREMEQRNGDDTDDDDRNVLFRGVDLVQTMSLIVKRIEGSDGSADAYGRRQSGVWSIGMTGEVMRSRTVSDGDDDGDDGMEDGWMKEGMEGEVDDVEGAWMGDGMEGGMEDKMKEDVRATKEKMMMTMMKKNCRGDLGSPLVAELEGRSYLLGVTTLPRGCLFGASPGLFTHVFNLHEWIRPIFNRKEPKRKRTMCTAGEFSCGDGWCIPEEYRCDGKKDCKLGTDEGQFCKGAMKGFNIYLDQHLNRSTVARPFPVTSFSQCAQACLMEPYLCPGFDVILLPTEADSPPIVSKPSTDDGGDYDDDDGDDDVDDGTKDVPYDVEDERGDKMPMMMDGMTIMCLLANSTSSVVGNKGKDISISRLNKAMMGKMPLAKPVYLHFKLPRHAPLAALFSPIMNLYLPTGLIVSPSYILGHDLAALLEDKSMALRFIKKLLMEDLVQTSCIFCFMSHPRWGAVREMEERVKMMREEAKNVLGVMMDEEGAGGGDGGMEGYVMRVREMKMQMRQMARNFTRVMNGMQADCDVMDIKRGLMMRIRRMMGNASCDMMGEDGDMVDGELREMEGGEDKEKPDSVMAVVMEMMEELGEVMPDLLMENMYPERDGMMTMMEMGLGVKMMMGRGSMMGDSWGMLGNGDVMSSFLTEKVETMMGMDPEDLAQNVNTSKLVTMMTREVVMIGHALATERCNQGNMTSGDAQEGWTPAMDADMDADDMPEANTFDTMRMKELGMRAKVGHQKWSIALSPRQVNTVNFRVLDVRGPMRGGGNIGKGFGMVVARGLGGVPMATDMIVSHVIRKMAITDQKMMDRDWGSREDMDGMSDGMGSPMTEEERGAMDWDRSTEDADTAAMGGVLPGNIDEDIFWKVVESLTEMTITSEMDRGSDLTHLIEAIWNGDIGKEAFIHGVGPSVFHRLYARVMMQQKMLDAPGRAYRLGDLHRGKSFDVYGSLVDVEQYTTNESDHGILMEYKAGWSCNQKNNKNMRVLTSPNFPRAYPSNARCNSFISAPPGHVVVLFVMRFKLQWSPYCLQDSLTVYDETTPQNWVKLGQGPFCGTTVPHIFRSSGQNLLVKFVSDVYHVGSTDKGFKIIYAFQPVARAMADQEAGPSSSSSEPEMTRTDAQTNMKVMRDKRMCMQISLGVISGVLFLVVVVGLVWIHSHSKTRREKAKEVYDTKF